jgi:hypothetical protein
MMVGGAVVLHTLGGHHQGRGSSRRVVLSKAKRIKPRATALGFLLPDGQILPIIALYRAGNRGYAMGMNNVQLYLAMGVPTLAVLIGAYFNQRSLERLEGRLSGRIDGLERRMDRLEARLDRIEADLREFYRTLGQHEARLDNLEKSGA